jgi:hypothetical protein
VIKELLTDRGIDIFIGFLGLLVYIRLIDYCKEFFQLSQHFSKPLNILLYFLNGCRGWLLGIGGREKTDLISKLGVDIF